MTRTLTLGLLLAIASFQKPYPPQAFVNRTTGKAVATYDQSTNTIRVTDLAPIDLRICLRDVCKTAAEWTAPR